jgi:hypothetical protein
MNAGFSHLRLGEPAAAAAVLEPAVEETRALGRPRDLAAGLVALGTAYARLGREEDAARLLAESRAIAAELQAVDVDAGALLALAETHASLGGHERAYALAREHADAIVAGIRAESRESLARFRAEYEHDLQEGRIAELEAEREIAALRLARERSIRLALIAGGLGSLAAAVAAWLLFRSRSRANAALAELNLRLAARGERLERALAEVQTLRGLLPVCAQCNSIRDEAGTWLTMETFIGERTGARFSHGFCPKCAESLYGMTAGGESRRG